MQKASRQVLGLTLAAVAATAGAQVCTTQSRMQAATRQQMADAALMMGAAVKANDAVVLKGATVAAFANNFGGIQRAVQETSPKLAGDTLRVTQVYELDATSSKGGEVDFSCPLSNTVAEVDFTFSALPPADYGFVMVEATGTKPWLLAFVLQKEGNDWKLAGFYPHARAAAGHDGLWYWSAARDHAKAKQPWLAWLDYSEADQLLRPADFVTTTQLDRLRAEQRGAEPSELADGLSAQTPLVVKARDGAEFHVTSLSSEPASDDLSLRLVLHYAADALTGTDANRFRNQAAAAALIQTHPELKPAYSAVIVFGETPGQNPTVLLVPMAEIK